MGVQETLRIATPEGVSLELPLAGVGSRFVALLVDFLLQCLVFGAVIVALVVTNAGGYAADAIVAVVVFAMLFAYPVAFELGAGGRTPGKRWSSLRVVCDDGSPVTFRASALRNVLRLVDILPGAYLVGTVAIFATRNNQRLGDLAAGTLVVREPRASAARVRPPAASEPVDAADELPAWDVSGLRDGQLVALRRFLERRDALEAVPRNLLARDLAERLRPSVGGVGADLPPERFLELIAALRRIRA
ncbi:MAG TPA: RDD family protein [Gaiellales bacterium]|jgi:uncharacterized RDD family membrane protein YckC|nr:RDD family protein [Gaiellales bacterium]